MLKSPALSVASSGVGTASAALRAPVLTRHRLGAEFLRLIPAVVDAVLVIGAFEFARQIDFLIFGEMRAYPWHSVSIYTLLLAVAMYLNEMYSFWQQRHTAELITSILRCQG